MNVLLIISIIVNVIVLSLIIMMLIKQSSNSGNKVVDQKLNDLLKEHQQNSKELRQELWNYMKGSNDSIVKQMDMFANSQRTSFEDFGKRVNELTTDTRKESENLRKLVDDKLSQLQNKNEKKLEEMRQTVDEKLHDTLEKRLGESFKHVQEHLNQVHAGLGEMKNLATGVGDLKKVLTNVKTRGTWGEVQLGLILEQLLASNQYEKNVKPNPSSNAIVEFAIKLPGQNNELDHIWLPIDAKYPQEDYERLVEASESSDKDAVDNLASKLLKTIEKSAKDIHDKYINPPYTTDFGIMFLPTEGLYAEVLRQPGFMAKIQQEYRIVIVGPTTLSATLNSLRMGFRTLAIEKRSSEVWNILSAVKTEFGKFGDVLAKVKKQLDTASNTIDQTQVRTRAMGRQLKDVEKLPDGQAEKLLQLD